MNSKMTTPRRALLCSLAAAFLLAGAPGCVERTMKIRTDPAGALVSINDEEVGPSPVKVAFLWYGDYDLVFRKTGYETLKTHHRVEPPWWQFPPFDIVAESLLPGLIRDEQQLPVFALQPASRPATEDVVKRATELRDQTLFETGKTGTNQP
jgi:hypothetical protein